jgi:hypothetical protein
MHPARPPSHREQHVDARRDYVVAEEENARRGPRALAGDADATSPARERAPLSRSRLATCFSTVRGDRCSRTAICLLASPPQTTEPRVRVGGQHDTASFMDGPVMLFSLLIAVL